MNTLRFQIDDIYTRAISLNRLRFFDILGQQDGIGIENLAHRMNDDMVHVQAMCTSLDGLCNAQFDELCSTFRKQFLNRFTFNPDATLLSGIFKNLTEIMLGECKFFQSNSMEVKYLKYQINNLLHYSLLTNQMPDEF